MTKLKEQDIDPGIVAVATGPVERKFREIHVPSLKLDFDFQ